MVTKLGLTLKIDKYIDLLYFVKLRFTLWKSHSLCSTSARCPEDEEAKVHVGLFKLCGWLF